MPLTNLKILLIEDEPLIALDVTETLAEAGAVVDGPVRSLAAALTKIGAASGDKLWDAVVLDYNLTDGTSEPVAEALIQSDIPFIFHSGLSEQLEPFAAQLKVPLIAKPATYDALIRAVRNAIRQ